MADVSSINRAMRIADRRDGFLYAGVSPPSRSSLLKFSNDTIISRASRLGISLGSSPSQMVSSVAVLKEAEDSRRVTSLKIICLLMLMMASIVWLCVEPLT